MNARLSLPLLSLIGFIAGFYFFLSPFYFTGGVVGLVFGCEGGEMREYFLGKNLGKHIVEDFWSMVFGVVVMAVSSLFGLTLGVALGLVASTKKHVPSPMPHRSSDPTAPTSSVESRSKNVPPASDGPP